MSLINDALKRARLEAIRQEAADKGVDYFALPANSRRRNRRAALLLGGWVAAVAVTVGVLWVTMRPAGDSPPADEVAIETPAAAGTPRVEPGPVQVESSAAGAIVSGEASGAATTVAPPPEDLGTAPPRQEASGLPAPAAPPTAPPGSSTAPAEAEVGPRPTLESAPSPRPETPTFRSEAQAGPRLEAGSTYLRRATSSDGDVVELGGIAYSDTRPIAVINGSVVTPGDLIGGFTVVAIEPERVELEGDGVRFYLSLH